MKIYAVILVTTFFVGCFGKEPEMTGLEGTSLPSFKLLLKDSTTYFDTKDISDDKPIALFFFGAECLYSKSQMQEIVDNAEKLKGIRFFIFTTSPFNAMKEFNQTYSLSQYPNITIGYDYTAFFMHHFNVPGVPYIALYGKDKRLRQAFVGKVEANQIKTVAFK